MYACSHLPRNRCGGRDANAGLVQTQSSLDLRKHELKQESSTKEKTRPLEAAIKPKEEEQ